MIVKNSRAQKAAAQNTASPDVAEGTLTLASTPVAGQVVPLPGGRSVSLSAPPDLTDEESAAAGAVLRLHHPAMFTSAAPGAGQPASGPGTWTLVFWPEYAPDAPESAHLSGPTFRRALADYIRTRGPALADLDDRAAIDAWEKRLSFIVAHHNFDASNASPLP